MIKLIAARNNFLKQVLAANSDNSSQKLIFIISSGCKIFHFQPECLRSKIAVFKEVSKTKKAVHFTFVSTYGLNRNSYSDMLVQIEVTMDALFEEA